MLVDNIIKWDLSAIYLSKEVKYFNCVFENYYRTYSSI